MNTIPVTLLPGVPMPAYKTEGSVGMDLIANIKEPLIVCKGEKAFFGTGVSIALPHDCEATVRHRSSVFNRGLVIFGTIDSDYRGEIKIVAWNVTNDNLLIEPGERIAQLVISPIVRVSLQAVSELPETVRGDGGFGHTGK